MFMDGMCATKPKKRKRTHRVQKKTVVVHDEAAIKAIIKSLREQ